ncbi:hypothetical protein [Halochromatium glycolicum]|uniref:hypothetical protein n=1 Tax=Halochromatium glycolicum TaxID=85075 RepID=UPI00190CC10C|nr:hypothetical protein [Halochromatium glycolicum]
MAIEPFSAQNGRLLRLEMGGGIAWVQTLPRIGWLLGNIEAASRQQGDYCQGR